MVEKAPRYDEDEDEDDVGLRSSCIQARDTHPNTHTDCIPASTDREEGIVEHTQMEMRTSPSHTLDTSPGET